MSIMFGGDAESFMEAPRMENKSASESLGFSPIAALLDLVGINRQVAKEPKKKEGESEVATPPAQPPTSSPAVLTDLETMLKPQTQMAPLAPLDQNQPLTPWGQRWLESNKPLMTVDPDLFLK